MEPPRKLPFRMKTAGNPGRIQIYHAVINMTTTLVLASSSTTRRQLLENAGLQIEICPARVDESVVRESMLADDAEPREIADALAEMKALRISRKTPGRLVLGCDQVLDLDGDILAKPITAEDARGQLMRMRGKTHALLSAAVICLDGVPIWRHVGRVQLGVRMFSEAWLDDYLLRNWPDIADSVGAYRLEAEGIRLFSRIEGDYFTVLGLPLLDLLAFLMERGDLPR